MWADNWLTRESAAAVPDMMGSLLDVETPMLAPFMLGLSLMTPAADAAGTPKLIRYDSYADDGDILVGAYFQEAPGFGSHRRPQSP